jgi:hypothetical protein
MSLYSRPENKMVEQRTRDLKGGFRRFDRQQREIVAPVNLQGITRELRMRSLEPSPLSVQAIGWLSAVMCLYPSAPNGAPRPTPNRLDKAERPDSLKKSREPNPRRTRRKGKDEMNQGRRFCRA